MTMKLLSKIKQVIYSTEPEAKVILFGSHARQEANHKSDIDLLILLDKETISREDEKRIKYPLYELEFETGQIISPLVLSKGEWESKHKITPFYEAVMEEGREL